MGPTKQASLAVGALALVDVKFAIAIALGFVSGWMVRAGQQMEREESPRRILRSFLISLLISGGGLITVLYLTKGLRENFEAVAAISFFVAWQGMLAFSLLRAALAKSMGFGLWLWRAVDDARRVQDEGPGRNSTDRLRWSRRTPAPDAKLDELARRLDDEG